MPFVNYPLSRQCQEYVRRGVKSWCLHSLKITPVRGFSRAFPQVFLYSPLHAYLYPYCAICLVYSDGRGKECKWVHTGACAWPFSAISWQSVIACILLCASQGLCVQLHVRIYYMHVFPSFFFSSLSCSGECSALCDQQHPLYPLWSWHILFCV